MAMSYLQIFSDKAELLEPFDDAERGRLLTAMLAYALEDTEITLTGNERYIWPVFRQMIDQSKAALHNKQAAGKARHDSSAQQTAAESQQSAADGSSDQQTDNSAQQTAAESPIIQESRIRNQESGIKNQERGSKRTRFTPPTADEVSAYAREKGLIMDAQRFCDHFASNGWKVGGRAPMQDWRAAARNWAARDKLPTGRGSPPGKTVDQQHYTQREYRHTEDAMDAMMAAFQREGASACG